MIEYTFFTRTHYGFTQGNLNFAAINGRLLYAGLPDRVEHRSFYTEGKNVAIFRLKSWK